MSDKPSTKDTWQDRYLRAAHAVQSGIAALMGTPHRSFTNPKHLRVGIDTCKRDLGSLAQLLIEKGIITAEEYGEAMADGMEVEAQMYEADVSEQMGVPVTLLVVEPKKGRIRPEPRVRRAARDAASGQFTTMEDAKARPGDTVVEEDER
jgi:hypothetical protein